jgi:hypothetical protein
MLFLELALIRWLGANVVHLSYFSNFVLMGSFLGVGLGFLRVGAPGRAVRPAPLYSPVVLLGLIAFISAYPVSIDRGSSQLIFFTAVSTTGPPIGLVLPAVFLSVAAVMAGPGELVGACFAELERLEAYRTDLLGSLLGIAAFTALSFLGSPPLVWFSIVAVLFVVLLGRASTSVSISLLVAVVLMFAYPLRHDRGVFWSPYYEVSTAAIPDGIGGTAWTVSVNGIPHQRLSSAAAREQLGSFYLQTYAQFPHPPGNVLIVGAGTGTDVAVALDHGARHIDAVEIDPTLLRFGRQHDPDHAYSDPRVTAHINDGRAFLQQSHAKYDLIIFALPDSLTLVSGASSLRLESYLFTRQSIEVARAHLAPGGAFSMYNFYRQQWLVDRLAGTLDDVFGHPPCVYENPAANTLAVMTAGLTSADQACAQTWVRTASTPPPATDDKPFLYLRHSTIPALYLNSLLLIILGSVLAIGFVLFLNAAAEGRGSAARWRRQVREMWSYRDLFLLGAAFLLLETKSVTGFALLFGTTWVVNSIVFAGVLIAVLGAVEFTRRRTAPPLPVMYALLLGALGVAWLVPPSYLLSLDVAARAVAATTLAFIPIFAANVIFASRFATTANAPVALGTNLLGAIVGGCAEYLSLVLGYRALILIAAGFYIAAFLVTPRGATRSAPLDQRDGVRV